MAKNIRRMLAMVLVMCMFVSALPMQALAAEGDELIPQTETVTEGPITNENGDTVTTTTTTSTDNSGNTTVTVEIQTESPISNGNSTVTVETQTESTSTSGNTTVNSGENTSSTTVQYKNEEGEVVRTDKIAESSSSYTETNTSSESGTSSTYVEEGQEWSKESMDIPEGGVKLDIPLTEDDPSTEEKENVNSETFGDPAGTKEVIDGEKPSEGDTNYEYTETTVLEQGKVTVETIKVDIKENPEADFGTDMDYVHTETEVSADNDLFLGGLFNGSITAVDPTKVTEDMIPDQVEGYDYNLISMGNSSQFYAGILYKEPAYDGEKPAYVAQDGTPYYAHRTNLGENHKLEGAFIDGKLDAGYDTEYKAVWANVGQYVLVDAESGELITTYCADVSTPTQDGYGYNVKNLEDATYYTAEQAAMIRTVAKNGYWGVAEGDGSLGSVKQMMRDAKDADGNNIFTSDEVDSLTDGMAMSATQFAIWTFSNHMEDIQIINAQYVSKDENNVGNNWWDIGYLKNIPDSEKPSVELIFKLYNHLITMDPTPVADNSEQPTTYDTIINDKNFVDQMSVTVIEKETDHANNQDADDTNDAYTTRLTFSLVVKPSTARGDDLMAYVLAADGETILASGRIAGEGELMPVDENGNYYFEGLTMIEGEQNFKLNLSGIQHLKEGVYLYSSEVRTDDKNGDVSSQTMVGLAGGNHGVNVTMDIEFNLNVEDEVMATERVWHYEHDPVITPPAEPVTPPTPPAPVARVARAAVWTAPENQRLANEEAVEIPEEPVPLATPAITGDDTGLWVMALMMIACCMVAINVFDKKRSHEAF